MNSYRSMRKNGNFVCGTKNIHKMSVSFLYKCVFLKAAWIDGTLKIVLALTNALNNIYNIWTGVLYCNMNSVLNSLSNLSVHVASTITHILYNNFWNSCSRGFARREVPKQWDGFLTLQKNPVIYFYVAPAVFYISLSRVYS